MEEEKIAGRGHFIAFLILNSVTLLLGIIDLCLPVWISYCWWDIGLIDASNNSIIINFNDETSISDVKNDICGNLESYVERSCPGACFYMENFRKAGLVMLVFGILSLISMMFTMAIPVLRLFKIRVKKNLVFVSIFQVVLWFTGICAYAGTANLGEIDKTVNKPEYNFIANNYKAKVGIAISITVLLLQTGILIYALFKIRTLLQNLVKV